METVDVEIYIPVIDETVEFMLPYHIKISDLLIDIIRQISAEKMSIAFDLNSSKPILCDREKHLIINPEETLSQAQIMNGTKLLLC